MVRYKCSNRAGSGSAPDEHTRNALVRERFVRDSPTISADTSAGRRCVPHGFFEDRSKDAYDRAAHAVQHGTASAEQRQMNAKMAKTAGSMDNKARAAEQGRLKDKKGWF